MRLAAVVACAAAAAALHPTTPRVARTRPALARVYSTPTGSDAPPADDDVDDDAAYGAALEGLRRTGEAPKARVRATLQGALEEDAYVQAAPGHEFDDRFRIGVRALNGDFDPDDASTDTEGSLVGAIVGSWPTQWAFTVVLKAEADATAAARTTTALVAVGDALRGAEGVLSVDDFRVEPAGTKFDRCKVKATVASAEVVDVVHHTLRGLPGAVMAF